MAHSTNDWFAAVDPIVNREFYGLESQIEKQMETIYDIASDDEPQKSAVEYAGPASLTLKAQNAAVTQKNVIQGPIFTWNAATYAGAVTASLEAVKDTKNRYAKLRQTIGTLGRATNITPQLLAALQLDRAFNSAYIETPGSLEMCSTAHLLPDGVTTQANELATPAALDESAAEDVQTNLRTMLGPDGNIMPHTVKGWIVPAALFNIATKLSTSPKTIGSANNDPSLVNGTKVLPFDYLGSNTRWFAKTNNPRGLFWDWIEKQQFLTDQVVLMLQKVFVAFFRARYGIVDFRGIYGSAAT